MAYTSYILPTWAAKAAFCNIGLISNIDSLLSSKLAQASLRFKGNIERFVPHSNKTYSYHVFSYFEEAALRYKQKYCLREILFNL